jgi:hypothetical protein
MDADGPGSKSFGYTNIVGNSRCTSRNFAGFPPLVDCMVGAPSLGCS